MQLSQRLTAIGEMVTAGNRLADVGCDHGYLPVALVLNKKIPSAIAMDVRKGPLARAMEHIRFYGLEDYIETRLSDGLQALKPGEAESLVIAGMDGPLMERILTEGAALRDTFQELILQPQSDIGHFRRFLTENGFVIVREQIVFEEGKFYPMMKAVHGEAEEYEEMEYAFGPLLLAEKNPVLREYLLWEKRIRTGILQQLRENKTTGAMARRGEIEEELAAIHAALQRYEM